MSNSRSEKSENSLRASLTCGKEISCICEDHPDQLEEFLQQYRLREIEPVALKAVMTKYNASWTPGRLCAELKKEHESINRKR